MLISFLCQSEEAMHFLVLVNINNSWNWPLICVLNEAMQNETDTQLKPQIKQQTYVLVELYIDKFGLYFIQEKSKKEKRK